MRDADAPTAEEKPLFYGVLPNARRVSELLLTLPLDDAGNSYVPCFTLSASDARGDETSMSWCVDAPFPLPSENHETTQLSSGRHTSSACSVSALAPGSSEQAGVVWLTAGLAAAMLRSRRRRSAP